MTVPGVEPSTTPEDPPSRLRRRKAHSTASTLIGQMVMLFADIEHDVDLCLRKLADTTEQNALSPFMDKLAFKQKLETLRQLVVRRLIHNKPCFNEFKTLHQNAQRMRMRRNAFVHGRWNPDTGHFQLAKPSWNTAPQTNPICPIPELRTELQQLKTLSESLRAWRKRWTT
jgi:hypothetical protein